MTNHLRADAEGMRTHRTPEKRKELIAAIRQTGTVIAACAVVGISSAMVYRWRRADPDFAREMAEAQEDAAERLVDEAWKRAVEGYKVPVTHKGEITDWYTAYSDRLLEVLLKARRPQEFRDRYEVAGTVTHTHSLDPTTAALLAANSAALGRDAQPAGPMIDITPTPAQETPTRAQETPRREHETENDRRRLQGGAARKARRKGGEKRSGSETKEASAPARAVADQGDSGGEV